MSPAASPEILHHTVWRTWLFIAYSDERWWYYQFSVNHIIKYIHSLFERLENVLFELRSERVNPSTPNKLISHVHSRAPTSGATQGEGLGNLVHTFDLRMYPFQKTLTNMWHFQNCLCISSHKGLKLHRMSGGGELTLDPLAYDCKHVHVQPPPTPPPPFQNVLCGPCTYLLLVDDNVPINQNIIEQEELSRFRFLAAEFCQYTLAD